MKAPSIVVPVLQVTPDPTIVQWTGMVPRLKTQIREAPAGPVVGAASAPIRHYTIANLALLQACGVSIPKIGSRPLPPWYATHLRLPPDCETGVQAVGERQHRLHRLQQDDTIFAHAMLEHLHQRDRLTGLPLPTLADPRYYRWARVRFVAGVDSLISQEPPRRLYAVTLIPPDWFVPAGGLWEGGPDAPTAAGFGERLRKHLNDAGGCRGGWMIAGLHASFEKSPSGLHTGYQFHHHAIVTEEMLPTIERLRRRPAYRPGCWVTKPIRVEDVYDAAGATTYLAKSYWSNRNSVDARLYGQYVWDGSRLANPYHTEALTWISRQRFADTILCIGCRLPKYVWAEGW